MSAPSTAETAAAATTVGMPLFRPAKERGRNPTPFGAHTMTPAALKQWEGGLVERTELCMDVARRAGAILTVYAGPDDRGGMPVAIISGLDEAVYVSRQEQDSDMETWIASILLEFAGEPEGLPFSVHSFADSPYDPQCQTATSSRGIAR